MNPYNVLGVTPEASEDEIKKAYRRAAKVAHPDHGGSTERMKDVNVAYKMLTEGKGNLPEFFVHETVSSVHTTFRGGSINLQEIINEYSKKARAGDVNAIYTVNALQRLLEIMKVFGRG